MVSRSFLTALGFLILAQGQAQAPPMKADDQLIFNLSDTAFYLAPKNSDSALQLVRRVMERVEPGTHIRARGNVFNALGWVQMHKGNLDSAIISLQQAWDHFSVAGYENDRARVAIHISEVFTKQSRLSEAIRYLTMADSLYAAAGDVSPQANIKRQLAIIYRESGDFKTSSLYFQQALEGFHQLRDYFRFVNTGISLSILYRSMKLNDSSLHILARCQELMEKTSATPYQTAMIEEHLAETYYEMGNYALALPHYKKAYAIFGQMNNQGDLAYESFCVGKTLFKLRQYGEAEKYLLRAYTMSDSLHMSNFQYDASTVLAEMYRDKGDWEQAYRFLQRAGVLKDSLTVSENIGKTNELKEQYEAEKKENEIALLKTKNELARTDKRRSTLLQYIFIILFVTSLAIAGLLLNRARIKRKLEEQLLRNQLAADLHDDIGSALSSIDINSRVAMVKNADGNTVNEQLLNIREHARKTMDSMSDIVWSINPINDNMESMLTRMREFGSEVCEPSRIEFRMEVDEAVEKLPIETEKRKNIFLIYKEAVNNAVKYSDGGRLVVRLEKQGTQFSLSVSDNGKGFAEEMIRMGNGLGNMKNRARLLKGSLQVDSVPGRGTRIVLSCPV